MEYTLVPTQQPEPTLGDTALGDSTTDSTTEVAVHSTTEATQRISSIPKMNDGVFSNVPKSKMEIQGLPSYDESLLIVDQAPPYLESSPFSYIEDGDVLVDGLLVGSWNDFILTFIMSFLFDFLGFFITSLLSTTHAGRTGSKFGFGLTLIRLGVLLQDELEKSSKKNENVDKIMQKVMFF